MTIHEPLRACARSVEGSAALPSRMSLDHPGWRRDGSGCARRGFRSGDALWAVICEPTSVTFAPSIEVVRRSDVAVARPVVDWFDSTTLPTIFRAASSLRDRGRVHRVRNPDLWDALIPPILRQRRRADDAERAYRRFCEAHGSTVITTAGPTVLPADPEMVVALPDEAFITLGLRGKEEPLRTVAEAYLKRAANWKQLPPAELFAELQTVTGIGAWTAGVAVADITNDHSFYKIPGYIAYHRWQERLAETDSSLTESDFVEAWKKMNNEQLSTLTVLLLASTLTPR